MTNTAKTISGSEDVKLTEADEVKRLAKTTRKAQLEGKFFAAWNSLFPSLPRPVMQHKFHPTRKWRFDFSFPDQLLAVEIDGGSFHGGGHNRGAQQQKDYEKMNTATAMGWRVLRFNTKDLDDPAEVATFVASVLTNARDVA